MKSISTTRASVVAPLTGAWIETSESFFGTQTGRVAPLTGAWIETTKSASYVTAHLSHPSRVRGLKLFNREALTRACCRTPHGCVD